jgi:hypothetical protein
MSIPVEPSSQHCFEGFSLSEESYFNDLDRIDLDHKDLIDGETEKSVSSFLYVMERNRTDL